ncbi:CHAT domain-containing protein [Candidatus Chloroploca sp. M-50]|uniref:CHAT domain-containing protein n=1 Tax=Candidatus Chloroploca mongolica TaxID=2528176 RepID=A0ABS4DE18_9CHLR|nr:CHAT domain-containing protein [Candidatus Chloroploca mongolica]MBP1467678.1 CHAT domain-containing protein [Candidatus Chloroploca mongolica]
MQSSRQTTTAQWVRLMQLAERDPRRSGRIACQWSQRGTRTAYEELAIGWALLRWERLEAAAQALGTAAANLPPSDHATHLLCERAQLMLAQLQGRGAELQAGWEDHVARCHTLPGGDAMLAARCEQVAHLNVLGRYREARTLTTMLTPLVTARTSLALQARFFHVSGVAAIGCGDFSTAQQCLNQAGALFRQLGHRAEVARVAFEQGWLALRREALATAKQMLEQAHTIYRRLDLPFRVALCERDLGTVAYLQNDYGHAIARGVAARTSFLALGRHAHAAGCDFNLGTVAHVSGLYDLAMAVYQRAAQTYRERGHAFLAFVAGRNQVLVACAQGDPAHALALADTLAAEGERLGDDLGACKLLEARARALLGLGRTTEAAETWATAASRFVALGNRGAAAACQLELAWLQLEAGDVELADRLLHVIAADLADRPAQLWRVHSALGRIAVQKGALHEARDAYFTAVTLVAGMRRRLASEHASSGIFRQAQDLHNAALKLAVQLEDHDALLRLADSQHSLSLEYQLIQATHQPATAGVREAAGRALREALSSSAEPAQRDAAVEHYLTTLLHTRHVTLPPHQPVEPCDPVRLRHELTAAYGLAWTLLCPLFTDDALLLVGVTAEGSFCTTRPYDQQLHQLLDRACLPGQRLMTYRDLARLREAERPAWATLSALGQCLLPTWLTARLAPQHRLLIVPSGPLHGLAWAALRVNEAWLCEQAILQILPNLRAARTQPSLDPHAPALLIGCSEFGTRAVPLPLVGANLEIAARTWPGPVVQLRDQAATLAALRAANAQRALERYGLIQIASHAQLGSADGLLAQIKLTDDDMLLDDVVQLRLQAHLVILTACEGGAGAVLPGDEVLSLSRALLTAGARSVIASLWTVYDQGLLALLEPLYQALAGGHDAPTALAHAQRDLCARPEVTGSMLHTPYIWGGFHVVCR